MNNQANQANQPDPDTHAGIRNTLALVSTKLRARQKVHHYMERDITIEKIESAIYWLDRLKARQHRDAVNAK